MKKILIIAVMAFTLAACNDEFLDKSPVTDLSEGTAFGTYDNFKAFTYPLYDMIIRPEQTTIADMFKTSGYTTGAVGKWHLGFGDKAGTQNWNGFITPGLSDIGFDYSYIMAATGDRVPCS